MDVMISCKKLQVELLNRVLFKYMGMDEVINLMNNSILNENTGLL